MKSQKCSRGIALLFIEISALGGGVGGQRHVPAALFPAMSPVTSCTGGWMGFRPFLVDAENPPPTGIRSPDRPASSESLYRLSHTGPQLTCNRNV